MAAKNLDGWEDPRTINGSPRTYRYFKIINQIELEIRTDKSQSKFEGIIWNYHDPHNILIMNIFYDESINVWRSLVPGVTPEGLHYSKPGPEITLKSSTIEELAAFMEDKAKEI